MRWIKRRKRKTVLLLIALLLIVCWANWPESEDEEIDVAKLTSDGRAEYMAENVMESLKSHSTETLSEMLCDRLHREHPKLDQEIREFYEFIDSPIVSYDEPNAHTGVAAGSAIFGRCIKGDEWVVVKNIKTSTGTLYELELNYIYAYLEQPDKLGITYIRMKHADEKTDQPKQDADYKEGEICRIMLSDQENAYQIPAIRSDPFEDTSEWELRDGKVYHGREVVYEVPEESLGHRRDLDASFVDSDCACLVYFAEDEGRIVTKYTQDGGAHWESGGLPDKLIGNFGYGCLRVSFVDRQLGYVYYASGDETDKIDALYITRDGGKHFTKAGTVQWDVSDEVMDMAFRTEEEGILLFYGDWFGLFDSNQTYALHTTDGGKKWKRIDFDEKLWDTYYTYDYVSGVCLEREHMDSERWVATLIGVKNDRAEYLHYYSDDAWKTWSEYPVSEERRRYGVFL